MEQKETDIQREIKQYILNKNILVERIQSGCLRVGKSFIHLARSGHPDLICYLGGGKTLFIEVKRPGGKLSDDQVDYHSRLKKLGHEVIMVTSLQEIETHLGLLGY